MGSASQDSNKRGAYFRGQFIGGHRVTPRTFLSCI
jgi:hypothetical protein